MHGIILLGICLCLMYLFAGCGKGTEEVLPEEVVPILIPETESVESNSVESEGAEAESSEAGSSGQEGTQTEDVQADGSESGSTESDSTESEGIETESTQSEAEREEEVEVPVQDEQEMASVHVVAIDPGHQRKGNADKEPIGPGSQEMKAKVASGTTGVSTGVKEYELTLEISLALKEELLDRGYEVVMIRETHDVDISNRERAEIANESGAEIFLRIHANGSENSQAKGTMTLCNTPKSPYHPEIYEQSRRLSDLVLSAMVERMGSENRGVLETDTMSGINWCTVPVTIVEMGFMSNPQEDELMQDKAYQEKMVLGMADGVDAYFRE